MIYLAVVSMLLQDVVSTLLVQAEARDKPALSGILDVFMWILGMTCTTVIVKIFLTGSIWATLEAGAAVSVANFVGTYAGVRIGRRFIKT